MSSAISPRSGRSEAGLDRRRVVAGAAAGVLVAALPGRAGAQAAPDLAQLVSRVTEGVTPERGRITLSIPALADNGNSVDTRIIV
jgi:sulfur-oxidizing protein SoxY